MNNYRDNIIIALYGKSESSQEPSHVQEIEDRNVNEDEIQIGDVVSIKKYGLGGTYRYYTNWSGLLNSYECDFHPGDYPNEDHLYLVVNIAKHDEYNDMLALIVNREDGAFIIGIDRIKKYRKEI